MFGINGGLISSISNSILSGMNYDLAKEQMEYKNQFQQDVFEYQKGVQQETWDRQDTAIQRRASDMEAAGLSKQLAAGSGADSSVVNTSGGSGGDTPQSPRVDGGLISGIINGVSAIQDIKNKQAMEKFIGSQTLNEAKKGGLIDAQTRESGTKSDLNVASEKNQLTAADLNMSQSDFNRTREAIEKYSAEYLAGMGLDSKGHGTNSIYTMVGMVGGKFSTELWKLGKDISKKTGESIEHVMSILKGIGKNG